MTEYPFIYIAALRRTGSTVLAEALTLHPYSFVFIEPRFGANRIVLKPSEVDLWRRHGIDLKRTVRMKSLGSKVRVKLNLDGSYMVRTLRNNLAPRILSKVMQIGVKEIRHEGWQYYTQYFQDLKIILTGRDPRDIYLSLYYRMKEGKGGWRGPYTPDLVAIDLNTQFRQQLKMYDSVDSMKLRYEDLCTDPNVYEAIKSFVRSPIPEMGAVGSFNKGNPKRVEEYDIHGDHITDLRVGRWQHEQDQELVEQAHQLLEQMVDYSNFWGYS